ncbi:MAG TPA: hypothetical protein VL096_06255, partial [Pirellulaceae bacterium]|nr:hypothetical protein [Pirellulaceae bacterium]
MQGILRFTVLFALSAILPAAAWADLAPGPGQRPRPRPMPAPEKKVASRSEVPAVVKKADLTKEGAGVQAKIMIPRKLLGDLAPPAAAAEPRASLGGSRSIFAGLALSMAAVSLVFVARG